MKKRLTTAAMLLALTGCALVTRFQSMTPKQKSLWLVATFTAEMHELREQAKYYYNPEVTDAEREVMRWKMTLLRQALPLIKSYIEAAEAGEEIAPDVETVIYDLLNLILSAERSGIPAGAILAEPPPQLQDA